MIIDTLANLQFYAALNPRIATVVEYLRGTDLTTIDEGRYEIDGDEVFMMVSENRLRQPAEALLEGHDRYLDIQIVIDGTESYGWQARAICGSVGDPYSSEKDIVFFDDKPQTYFMLNAGGMALFFPDDAHAPLVGEGTVRKCVVKVRCPEQ